MVLKDKDTKQNSLKVIYHCGFTFISNRDNEATIEQAKKCERHNCVCVYAYATKKQTNKAQLLIM